MQQQQEYDTKLLYIAPVHVSTAVEHRLSMPPAKTYFKMDPELKTPQEANKEKPQQQQDQQPVQENTVTNPEILHLSDEVLTNKYYSRKLNSMYRAKVMDAYYNRRIFVVYGFNNVLRRALIQRGWLEKLVPGRYDDIKNSSDEILTKYAREGNDYEAVAISKLIGDLPAFFVWQFRRQPNLYANVQPYRNVIRRNRNLDFTTKVGLIGCAEQEHWFYEPGVSAMSYPRFYRLGYNDEERQAFIDDFRRTQVFSLLRYVQEHHRKPHDIIDRERGTVPFALFKNAVMLVTKWMHDREDVMTDNDWNEFINESNEIIRREGKFKISIRDFNEYIKTVQPLWKHLANSRTYNWDGCRNVWILKPGYLCRGSGIVLRDTLPAILEYTRINTARRYIAQKYIERPCLIYNTKFDIRQYMILSIGTEKIKIWLCRDCYLKFSSQQFKLNDLAESIHLTNNSVQKNYENDKSRDSRLPAKNMWSLAQFKAYLTSEGHVADKVWNTKVFEGFKQCVIAVVLASIEETELVPNTFEMYGVDFMLDEQFNPILIEVNATPDLSPSTEVTAHLCPLVIKDLVRVIVDVPRDKSASTGLFELVYEKNYHFNENYVVPSDMNVDGKAMLIHPMDYRKIPKGRNERIYGTFYARKTKTPAPEDGMSYENMSLKSATKKGKKGKKYKDPTQLALLKKIKSIHDGAESKKASSSKPKIIKK